MRRQAFALSRWTRALAPVRHVYGTLLNHRAALAALGDAVNAAAVQGAAAGRRCCTSSRATRSGRRRRRRAVPAGAAALRGRRDAGHRHRPQRPAACRPGEALEHVAGYTDRQRRQRAARAASTGRRCASRPRRLLPDRPVRSSPRAQVRRPRRAGRPRRDRRRSWCSAAAPRELRAPGGAADRRRHRVHDAVARRRAAARRRRRRAAGARRAARARSRSTASGALENPLVARGAAP